MTSEHALARSAPEDQGIDPAAICALVDALGARRPGVHSLMVLRHGSVVAEGWWAPYDADRPHIMFSVSKSFTATAIGIAQDEGLLSVDEPVLDFFPSYATPGVRANVADLRLRHVLAMATGHATDTMRVMRALPDDDWVRLFLEVPIEYPPGTHFLYNSGASFLLSAIVASRTGRGVREYLGPRLFEPLGITEPAWQTNRRGIELGASGLRLRTEDLAKFGQLYLQRGRWEGRQLLSERWVEEASRSHVRNGSGSSDWSQGYGFQMWRSQHDSYRADGAYGQFCLVVPGRDLVVAITAGTRYNQEIVPAVWEHLLPGLHDRPLAGDEAASAALAARLGSLEVPVPACLPGDPLLAGEVAGRRITVGFNVLGIRSLELSFDAAAITLRTYGAEGDEETVVAGRDGWVLGTTRRWPHEEMDEVVVAARGGWLDERTLGLEWQLVETPFRRAWRLRFDPAGAVDISVGLDLGFWEDSVEVLEGHLAAR